MNVITRTLAGSDNALSSLQSNHVRNNFNCDTNISFPYIYYYNNKKLITIGENHSFSHHLSSISFSLRIFSVYR